MVVFFDLRNTWLGETPKGHTFMSIKDTYLFRKKRNSKNLQN